MFSLATTTRARFASSRSIGRALSAVALTFTLMGSAACSDSKDGGTGPGAVAGTYSLKTVKNANLPASIWEGTIEGHDVAFQVRSGSVTLDADGSYVTRLLLRTIVDDEFEDETLEAEGTYTRSGNKITFKDGDEDIVGTLENGTLKVQLDLLEVGENVTFAYKK
jgi:hypothetical protein